MIFLFIFYMFFNLLYNKVQLINARKAPKSTCKPHIQGGTSKKSHLYLESPGRFRKKLKGDILLTIICCNLVYFISLECD